MQPLFRRNFESIFSRQLSCAENSLPAVVSDILCCIFARPFSKSNKVSRRYLHGAGWGVPYAFHITGDTQND